MEALSAHNTPGNGTETRKTGRFRRGVVEGHGMLFGNSDRCRILATRQRMSTQQKSARRPKTVTETDNVPTDKQAPGHAPATVRNR